MNTVILRNEQDWQKYREVYCNSNALDMSSTRWGNGPGQYPCLVMSYHFSGMSPQRVLTCFVFVTDALALLKVAAPNGVVSVPDPASMPTYPGMSQDRPVLVSSPVVAAATDNDIQVNAALQSLAAHVLALTSEMIDIGATKAERYQAKYSRFLAMTDQVIAENVSNESVQKTISEDKTRQAGDEKK